MGVHAEIREILAFSVAHDTKPMIELFAMNGVNLALHPMRHNDMRSRAVLVNETDQRVPKMP